MGEMVKRRHERGAVGCGDVSTNASVGFAGDRGRDSKPAKFLSFSRLSVNARFLTPLNTGNARQSSQIIGRLGVVARLHACVTQLPAFDCVV